MIVGINYAEDRFKPAQKLNTKTALKHGVDRVIEYSPESISAEFKAANKEIFSAPRGVGYWIWKPYILKDALSKINEGDYLIYTDSGVAYEESVTWLLEAMQKEHTDIMCFASPASEYRWTKHDAFVLMGCEDDFYKLSPQCCGGYMIFRNTEKSRSFIDDFLHFACDSRIISDLPSTLGEEHPEFLENRHDQTIWSLLCKKNHLPMFRNPSQEGGGWARAEYSKSINSRSEYPVIFLHHRKCYIQYEFQLKVWKVFGECRNFWKYFSKITCAIFHIKYIKNPYRSQYRP